MTREEALTRAQDVVAKMATNARGFMDGAPFTARVSAVLDVARFLLGEDDQEDE